MKAYTVSQLAKMAGVSVRALHHYDHIGLLAPSARTAAGYRIYQEDGLLRLQQILFFRELGFALGDIRSILDDPEFDRLEALEEHRRLLLAEVERLAGLMMTVDRTIARLTEDDEMRKMTDQELYEGFTKGQIERYKRQAREQYDPVLVEASEERVAKLTKAQWHEVKGEGGRIARELAALMDRPLDDPQVQALMTRQHAWIENFYPCSAEVFVGLGALYAGNDEFRAFYDKYAANLADFMQAAMEHYAAHVLEKRSA